MTVRHVYNDDNDNYLHFTAPGRRHQAVSTLYGMLLGITCDGKVSDEELVALRKWLDDNRHLKMQGKYKDLFQVVGNLAGGRQIDQETVSEMQFLCRSFAAEFGYYDEGTQAVQVLHGMLQGIIADGVVTAEELRQLQSWMDDHEHLANCWPFTETRSLVADVMADGRIDEEEHERLLHHFQLFGNRPGQRSVATQSTVTGICALDPQIEFAERTFCFTGRASETRSKLEAAAIDRGAICRPSVSKNLNYLVVGADGSECWAFACYGRKIEQVMEQRQQGATTIICHEHDYLDAIAE